MQLVYATHLNVYKFSQFAHVGSVDYAVGPYNVTFPAGMTMTSFNILLMDDNLLESNEQFQLIIVNSLPDRVTTRDPNQATVTIMDDDRKPQFWVMYAYILTTFSHHHHLQPVNIQC